MDDHLALRVVAGERPSELPAGPVATTYGFHYRLVRALADSDVAGALSRQVDPARALRRVLHPPAHRLVVLDPRVSLEEAVDVAVRHEGANLLLAELVGAARHHRAPVRVTRINCGRAWPSVMAAEEIDFGTL